MEMEPLEDPALGLYRVLGDDGSPGPGAERLLAPDQLIDMYRHMLGIRLLDERMLMRQRQGKVGFFGTITGEEAVPIGVAFATQKRDWIFPALRQASIMIVRGFPLKRWIAQVYGNAADELRGRMQPSHMSSRSVNQVSWSSCIGTQLPQAVGAAWAAKLKADDVVSIGFLGDGATSEADFHAALTFAGVYRVPCVFVCQNNHWSISVPLARQTASETLAIKARAYGIPAVRVDGNDVLAVLRVVKSAVDKARAGGGPSFVEAVTYRIGPHSSSDDPTRYRQEAEVDAWRARDPIERFERFLRAMKLLDDRRRDAIRKELTDEIVAAIHEVESLPPPALDTLFSDVYREAPWHLREQAKERASRGAPRPHE